MLAHSRKPLLILVLLAGIFMLTGYAAPIEPPAIFVPCDSSMTVYPLGMAILNANASPGTDVISLEAGCVHDLTGTDNVLEGNNGLPIITESVIIEGNGSTLRRIPQAEPFRLLYIMEHADVTLRDLTLEGGLAGGPFARGGAILSRGKLTLENVTFVDNSAGAEGGAIFVFGAAQISNSLFENNEAQGHGGGLYAAGPLLLDGSDLLANLSGGNGGGVYVAATATVMGSTFNGNSALTAGGGLYARQTLHLANSFFEGNGSSGVGGGLFLAHDLLGLNTVSNLVNVVWNGNIAGSGPGSSMYLVSNPGIGRVVVQHNTLVGPPLFVESVHDDSSGIFIGPATATIENSIITQHFIGVDNRGVVTSRYNLFFANGQDERGRGFLRESNLVNDPLFVSSEDLRLQFGSPAVDSGLDVGVKTDILGVLRPAGGGFDRGAYESLYLIR